MAKVKKDSVEESEEMSLANWDSLLATEAQAAAEQEKSTALGNRLSIRDGDMELPDGSPVPGNVIACVILDSIIEHVYYTRTYDANNPEPPKCFAMGRDEEVLKPHQVTLETGSEEAPACKGCPHNEWGSADKGKGKACRSVRRLAVVVAGTLDEDGKYTPFSPTELAQEQVMTMRVPTTSLKAYAGYVMRLSSTLKRPPFGVVTRLWTKKDKVTKFKVHFETLAKVENSYQKAIVGHKSMAQNLMNQPYPAFEERAPTNKKGKVKLAKGKATGPSNADF